MTNDDIVNLTAMLVALNGRLPKEMTDSLKRAIFAAKKQIISEWHDMRKNPTDFPVDGEPVILRAHYPGGEDCGAYDYVSSYSITDDRWALEQEWVETEYVKPVAWRYYDNFEEEK